MLARSVPMFLSENRQLPPPLPPTQGNHCTGLSSLSKSSVTGLGSLHQPQNRGPETTERGRLCSSLLRPGGVLCSVWSSKTAR